MSKLRLKSRYEFDRTITEKVIQAYRPLVPVEAVIRYSLEKNSQEVKENEKSSDLCKSLVR